MPKFEITAWPVDDAEREYNPTWNHIVEAETIGDAYADGKQLFTEQCPDLDQSQYFVHASAA